MGGLRRYRLTVVQVVLLLVLAVAAAAAAPAALSGVGEPDEGRLMAPIKWGGS